jgi:hypothetical protein
MNTHGLLRPLRAFLLVTLSFCFTACKSTSADLDQKVLGVFSDFVYVGSGSHPAPASNNDKAGRQIIAHGELEETLPRTLRGNTQYVFHPRGDVDSESLAIELLPARLRAAGATSVQAPRSTRDMVHLIVGDPLFTIRFQTVKHRGLIFNRLCTHLSSDSAKTGREDYVLVIQ